MGLASDTTQYKCPACGGTLAFDPGLQKLKCPFCDNEFDVSTFVSEELDENAPAPEMPEGPGEMNWDTHPGQEWGEGEEDGMVALSCESCGGEVVCEETTSATSCPYCGSNITIKSKLSGTLKPDLIIPFKLDKAAAKEALKKHVNSKKLVPPMFKTENHIEEIKGVYVPFWLFDADVDASVVYSGEKLRFWSDSKYNYTEHRKYEMYRQGSIAFDNVPVDGVEKIPNDFMESVEPFDISEATDFNSAFLAGYMANKYDVDADASIGIANERIRKSTESEFRNTVVGYNSVIPISSNVNLKNGDAKYALYPVWLLNTKWNGQIYTFAMNGQTGKFIGDLPLDKGLYWKKWFITMIISGVIASLAVMLADLLFF